MPETVDRTVLSRLKTGDKVNLERTLRVGDRFGGHIVSGHIDGVGTISGKNTNDIAVIVRITAEPQVMRYIVEKGSIAIDGTSLTVVEFGNDWFTVSLIPHTAGLTTVGLKSVGEVVNLEADVIGKYVERLMGFSGKQPEGKENMNAEFLRSHGFM